MLVKYGECVGFNEKSGIIGHKLVDLFKNTEMYIKQTNSDEIIAYAGKVYCNVKLRKGEWVPTAAFAGVYSVVGVTDNEVVIFDKINNDRFLVDRNSYKTTKLPVMGHNLDDITILVTGAAGYVASVNNKLIFWLHDKIIETGIYFDKDREVINKFYGGIPLHYPCSGFVKIVQFDENHSCHLIKCKCDECTTGNRSKKKLHVVSILKININAFCDISVTAV